jgi:hypothetical protein
MSMIQTEWKCQPEAEKLVVSLLETYCHENKFIATLQENLLKLTSTRLFDWLDHVTAESSEALKNQLLSTGYVEQFSTSSYQVYHHPGAQLPRVVLDPKMKGIAVSVDSIADFLMTQGRWSEIEGSPLSGYRRSIVHTEKGVSLLVVERRATTTMEPMDLPADYLQKYYKAKELWQRRPRHLKNEHEAMQQTIELAKQLVHMLGQDLAAWVVLECERIYWQSRNSAGQAQKNRQDRLGMGWANHDHHTFRSSRGLFKQLVGLFEVLGFHCRERYYAGKEAGWGAQIMENPRCRLVLFLDVDLAAEEIDIDFAHEQLPPLGTLGTIGLWCALHGDSILKAGMHHLEAQFMFEDLTKDLAHLGIGMMSPFSSFPYLKQAFTAGEIWHVDADRIEKLHKEEKITKEQAEKFKHYGAVGSHLENLQRREGYKGFNQKNVSYIIKKTDPRTIK